MTGYISQLTAIVSAGGRAPGRVGQVTVQVQSEDRSNPLRLGQVTVNVQFADRSTPLKVSQLHVVVLTSIQQSVERVPTRPTLLKREANPYRPTVPDELYRVDPTTADYLTHQAATIRLEHNKSQAGDSTVPWEFLAQIGPERLYTLGSQGRFYHDDFGIIHAVYVEFTHWRDGPWLSCPVGRLKSSKSVDWKVSNDPDLCDPDEVLGILGSFKEPINGWFGWIITKGANIASLKIDDRDSVLFKDALMWGGFETLSTQGKGKVIGRALTAFKEVAEPGQVMIDIESASPDAIRKVIAQDLGAIDKSLIKVKEELAKLPTDVGKDIAQAKALGQEAIQSVAATTQAIKTLEKKVQEVAGALTQADYDRLQTAIVQLGEALNLRINSARDIAVEAQGIANQLIALGIPQRLLELEDRLARLGRRAMGPLVTGEIPPVLVYLPDGSLVLTEYDS